MQPLENIPVPVKLMSRPTDRRGYPIPWMTQLDATGKPDFRVTDSHKWVQAAKARQCAMCGEPTGRHLAFIGGPVSFETRLFTDLPMHKECAAYAVQVCPFLAAPNMRYAEILPSVAGVPTAAHTQEMVSTRPERFFVATTRDYRIIRTERESVLAQAAPWEWSEWWRHGERIELSA